MIVISDNAAFVLVILAIGFLGAFIGGLTSEVLIRLAIWRGWIPRRVLLFRMSAHEITVTKSEDGGSA